MTARREDPLAVLEHAPWLESLARGLVADPGLAEDLAQETRILAWSRRPDASRPLRGWLATVMRNLLRQHRRSEARRAVRDRGVSTDEHDDSAETLAARLEAHRQVVEAVAALDDPYRTTILLRFFEGKSPTEIATESAVPIATVKTRLQRALALLRERLDRSHGRDGRSWKRMLAPLVRAPDLPLAALLGVVIVNVKILSVVAVVLLGAGALFWTGTPSPHHASVAPVSSSVEAPAAAQPPALERGESVRREAEPERAVEIARPSSQIPQEAGKKATPNPRLRGEVLDGEGKRMPGFELRIVRGVSKSELGRDETGSIITTDAHGRFDIEPPADWTQIVASASGWTTIYPGTRTMGDADLAVVVARAIECSGVVVDEAGAPQADVNVEFVLPTGFRNRFERVLDNAGEFFRGATTGTDGAFVFGPSPRIEGATIHAERIGFSGATIDAPRHDAKDLRIVLLRAEIATERIDGLVLDPFGAPAPDAIVSLRGETTTTDAAGRFSIAIDDAGWIDRLSAELRAPRDRVAGRLAVMGLGASSPLGAKLVAVKPGFLPAVLFAAEGEAGTEFPRNVILQLGAEPLAIAGRVLAADGTPASGARVWVADPDLLGLAAGGSPAFVENAIVVGASPDEWRFVTTDDRGEFELEGLTARPYRLVAMDANLLRVSVAGVPAGSNGVELRFPSDGVHARIRGRVVTMRGEPVGGARVVLRNDAFSLAGRTNHGSGASVVTDSQGRFEFTNVPCEGVYLRVDGEGMIPAEFGRDLSRIDELVSESGRSAAVLEIELRVSARCHMQIRLAGANEADRFGVVDAAGATVPIELFSGSRRTTQPRFALVDGTSPVVAVREDAAEVVLYRGDQEVRRIPIALTVGKVNDVGP